MVVRIYLHHDEYSMSYREERNSAAVLWYSVTVENGTVTTPSLL